MSKLSVNQFSLVAFLPEGLEQEGSKELENLGAKAIKVGRNIVECKVDLACFYRINLRARLPFRLLREISQFPCKGKDSLYHAIQHSVAWEKWLDPSMSFRVDVSGGTEQLRHTHFTALQVKNAIVDLQRKIWGERSKINLHSPDISLHLHLFSNHGILSLASSENSLHRRGYRSAVGKAPLKENIASGLLQIANWDDSLPLVDPLCGSGTFLIEAVSIARGIAPGLNRTFLFENWPDYEPQIWKQEKKIAKNLFTPLKKLPKILGCESNIEIANQAKMNIAKAGLDQDIQIFTGDFIDMEFPKSMGLIVCNPPYGKRLGNVEDLEYLYKKLGFFLKQKGSGWDFWLLNGNSHLSKFIGMKCSRRVPINNGGIDCRWLHYRIH